MTATATNLWDRLYLEPRFNTVYPSEHVVRFLNGLEPGLAIDIGCGAGRHTHLLRSLGYKTAPVDASCCFDDPQFVRANMAVLPFSDDTFDVAVSYGVFYYGTYAEGCKAVDDLYRVLKQGGQAFVCVRTNRDWRRETSTDGTLNIPGEPEHGMEMHFLDEHEIPIVYHDFSTINIELSEWTTHDRERLNSDWLITLTK